MLKMGITTGDHNHSPESRHLLARCGLIFVYFLFPVQFQKLVIRRHVVLSKPETKLSSDVVTLDLDIDG